MNQLGFPILSILLGLPALGAVALLLTGRDNVGTQRQIAVAFTLATFLLSIVLPVTFVVSPVTAAVVGAPPVMQFQDRLPWVPGWGINYLVSIDGISLWLVLLTTFIALVVALIAPDMVRENIRHFLVLLLFFESMLLGVFMAQDMFLFYIFWELALLPAVFMVGIWGSENRVYAALRFFLFTFAGSVFMLLGIVGLYILHRTAITSVAPGATGTFDVAQIVADLRGGQFRLDILNERLLFGAFLAAFIVKVPIWPFHTWLPDAYSSAPTPATIMLSAVMSKMGAYGLIRFNLMLFPDSAAWAAPAIGVLAVIGILYGAIAAFAQNDMKRLVAYSSLSHMGFIVLGIFALNPIGISGAVAQMVNHGVSTAALFLIVGALYTRYGSYDLSAYSGLWKVVPVFGTITLVMVLSSMGLPGLNGFVGEYAVMQGALTSPFLGWPFVGFAAIGVVLAAAYLLRMYRGAFMGDAEPEQATFAEITRREAIVLGLLLIPVVAVGLYPNLLFGPMQYAVTDIANAFTAAAQTVGGR